MDIFPFYHLVKSSRYGKVGKNWKHKNFENRTTFGNREWQAISESVVRFEKYQNLVKKFEIEKSDRLIDPHYISPHLIDRRNVDKLTQRQSSVLNSGTKQSTIIPRVPLRLIDCLVAF